MRYAVKLGKTAESELRSVPREILRRVCKKLVELGDNPRPPSVKKLTGVEGYRLRIGDYRVLFTIDDEDNEVRVYRIKHRKEAYK